MFERRAGNLKQLNASQLPPNSGTVIPSWRAWETISLPPCNSLKRKSHPGSPL
jgi:hypothetical protein